MKLFSLFVLLLAFAACAPAPDTRGVPLPENIQRSADAITARQTADAAQFDAQQAQARAQDARARAEQFAAEQTAIAQSTRDAAAYAQTRVALDIQIANVTRQSELDRATATENARRANIASAETSQARAETRAAVQTQTRRAEEIAMLAASQTRVAAYPTQTRIAEQIAQDQAERERAARIAASQAEWDANVKPVTNLLAWTVLPLAVVCGLVLVLLLGTWRLFRALENYVQSKSLAVSVPALAQMQIRDVRGNPLGYLQIVNGVATFQPYFDSPPALPADTAAPVEPPPFAEPNDAAPRDEHTNLIRVNNPLAGDQYISRSTPEEDAAKIRKSLALRLLRDAMQYYAQRNTSTRVAKIPSWRELEWSSETWVRAVDSLKPYVLTKSGRGGGTFCGPEYPNLVALYDAVGNNKVMPRPGADVNIPPPRTVSALAA